MAIPTRFDHELGEIENAASSVSLQLRTMHRAASRDLPAMRAVLRDRVQTYVNAVMALADDGNA